MALDPIIASDLVSVVDTRWRQLQKTQPRTAYGIVASVDDANQKCTVYVSGDAVPSIGFTFQRHEFPTVGDRVRVVIDPRGDKYVDAVIKAGSDAETEINGYLREVRSASGTASNLSKVAGDAEDRFRVLMGPTATHVQMGDGTAIPITMLNVDIGAGTWEVAGFPRLRYVQMIQNIYSAATTTTRSAAALTPEITSIPIGVGARMVTGLIRVRNSVGAQTSGNYGAVRQWSNQGIAAACYPAAVDIFSGCGFVATIGGTNGRQIYVELHAGPAGTLTYQLDITGYFADDN